MFPMLGWNIGAHPSADGDLDSIHAPIAGGSPREDSDRWQGGATVGAQSVRAPSGDGVEP